MYSAAPIISASSIFSTAEKKGSDLQNYWRVHATLIYHYTSLQSSITCHSSPFHLASSLHSTPFHFIFIPFHIISVFIPFHVVFRPRLKTRVFGTCFCLWNQTRMDSMVEDSPTWSTPTWQRSWDSLCLRLRYERECVCVCVCVWGGGGGGAHTGYIKIEKRHS